MKGSFTVELSLIFPVMIVVLLIFMQFGLYFTYRICTMNVINQTLTVCSRARQEKKTTGEAAQLVENYLHDALVLLPIEVETMGCKTDEGWFKEEYTVWVTARYSLVFDMSWSAMGKSCVMNPATFRNRLDFIWEKGKQYLVRFKNE